MMILLKVTRARSVLTTAFWMTGYAAKESLSLASIIGVRFPHEIKGIFWQAILRSLRRRALVTGQSLQ